MEEIIRLVVSHPEKNCVTTIYLSMLIAYLEIKKWHEAEKILKLLENMTLSTSESWAFAYLSVLEEYRDIKKIRSLVKYLDQV